MNRVTACEKTKSEYEEYIECLSETNKLALGDYFSSLSEWNGALTSEHKKLMCEDAEKAFVCYAKMGVALNEAMERLSVSNLGCFYARLSVAWYPLDDAAKIFPLSMQKNQMSIFRLSVYLKSDVIPELLQMALTFTIKRFPSFATTIKKGFFWHYTDSVKRRFTVEPETNIPCRPLNVSSSGSQSFRVMYFKNRISVECFHILADGTGGMVFLKTLIREYLKLNGVETSCTNGVFDINDTPQAEETSNDFYKAEPSQKGTGFMDKPAVQMSGRISVIKPCRLVHFELATDDLKLVAKQKGATITAYILALMFVAEKYATDETVGNIQIQVPVNMRNYYESKTINNFSLYCNIKLAIPEISDVDDIIPNITQQLKDKTSVSAMNEMMNATITLVRGLSHVPLFIKSPVAKIVYGFLGDRAFSNILSNLGVVKVPEEMVDYIERFEAVLGTPLSHRAACSVVSFGKVTVLSVAKCTIDPSFEERLFYQLNKEGLSPIVKGSEIYES